MRRDKPLDNVERERVLHGGAGDAGGVEVIKEGHVGAVGVKLFHALVKSVEQILDSRIERARVRKSTEEKQTFVEADELVRIGEL